MSMGMRDIVKVNLKRLRALKLISTLATPSYLISSLLSLCRVAIRLCSLRSSKYLVTWARPWYRELVYFEILT